MIETASERGCRRTSMPAINGLGLVISTFRDYGENIEETQLRAGYVRVNVEQERRGSQSASQPGGCNVYSCSLGRLLCHFVFTSLSLPRMHNNQNKLLPN